MNGWFPFDDDAWEAITWAIAKPWPSPAAAMDLRWWQDRSRRGRGPRPGRVELARRWGWTDWGVKCALKEADEWEDPRFRQPAARRPPARRQATASPPPAPVRTKAEYPPDSASLPPGDRQATASPPPGDRPARVYKHRTQNTEHRAQRERAERADSLDLPPPSAEPSPPPPASDFDERLQVAELVALQEADSPELGLATDRDRRAVIRALGLGVAVEQLRLVWAWSGAAPDRDAAACRSGGWRRWGSLLRSREHVEERVAAAERWHVAGRPTGPPSRAAPKGRDHFAELEALRQELSSTTTEDTTPCPAPTQS